MYIKFTETNYSFIPRPNWLNDTGEPVSDDELAGNQIYRVDDNIPEYDSRTHTIKKKRVREWTLRDNVMFVEYEVEGIPFDILRNNLKEKVSEKRWEVLNGGITLPNGLQAKTDETSFNRVTSVIAGYVATGLTEESIVSFKAATGFVKITIVDIKQIAGLMGQHMQACFAAEEAHYKAIDLLESREDIANYNVSTGWPNQDE